jgi:hypothetical protein
MYDDDDKDQVVGGNDLDDTEKEDELDGDTVVPVKPASDDEDDLDKEDDLESGEPGAKDKVDDDKDDDLPSGFHTIDEE